LNLVSLLRVPVHLTLCVLLAGVSCRREEPRPDTGAENEVAVTPVAAEPAQRGRLRAVIRTTGVVTPAAGAEFIASASEPARILEIPHAEGDRVASGDVLVRFAMPAADAEASRQRAEIARAQARLENARFTQSRSRELLERGIISRREMENADNDVTEAQAEVARAEAARASAEASMARAIVRAPFAGIIAQRLHDPGDLTHAIATDPILRLVDPDRLEVTASVTAADAPRILPGAAARITSIPGAEPVRLTVAARPSAAASGADAIVRLGFVEPAAIAADTRVEIEIDGEERVDVILVGAGSLISRGSEMTVFVATNNTAERRIVTTGLRDADLVEITSGINAGELVITRGQVGLTDGAAISVDTLVR
jgi:RND family efflux transporter MFP subunit